MTSEQMPGQQSLDSYRLPQVSVRLRLEEERALYSSEPLDSPEKATGIIKDLMRSLDREMIVICNLDVHLRPINFNIVASGGLNYAPAEIGMIYRTSMLTSNCNSVLMFHNHPSGLTAPSGMDIEMTRRVSQAGALLGIPLRDHIIIGGGVEADPPFSFHEHFPEYFSGVYDPENIQKMLEGSSITCLHEKEETMLPELNHGRTR